MVETSISAIHTEQKLEVELIIDDISFYVDGRLFRFDDPRQSAIAVGVVRSYPTCLTFRNIAGILDRQGRTGGFNNDHSLNLTYVRKKIMEINVIIKAATGASRFVENVRGQGYILSSEWAANRLTPIEQKIGQDLEELARLVNWCVEVVENGGFVVSQENIKTLIVDDDVRRTSLIMYEEMRSRLLVLMGAKSKIRGADLQLFELMESYVTFSRSGQDIQDHSWRIAYKTEIISVYEAITQAVEHAMRVS